MLQFPTKLTIDARNPDSELRARILATKPRATKGIFLSARCDPSRPGAPSAAPADAGRASGYDRAHGSPAAGSLVLTMPHTTEEHVDLSRAVMRLLTAWGVPAAQQPVLLGLDPSAHRRELNRCRFGAALPDTGDVYTRARLLLAISAAVAQLFPHSSVAAEVWVTTPQLRFGGHTPLEIMLEDGSLGMRRVVDYLMGQSPL